MKLSKKILQLFFESYPNDTLPLAFVAVAGEEDERFESVTFDEDGQLMVLNEIGKDYLKKLDDDDCVEIALESACLRKICSVLTRDQYFLPPINLILPAEEAFEFMKICENMNAMSEVERNLILARDIELGVSSQGVKELVASCGDALTKKLVRKISLQNEEEGKNIKFPITLNEKGFIIFTDKDNENSQGMHDLREILQKMDQDLGVNVPHAVITDRKSFFEYYQRSRPEVVILVNHQQRLEGMLLYIHLKKVDPFAKLLELDQKDLDGGEKVLHQKLKIACEQSYKNIALRVQQNKIKLDIDTEDDIKQQILSLKKNYQKTDHVKIIYQICRLSIDYDVRHLSGLVEVVVR